MFSTPDKYINNLSNPRPKPACLHPPYLRRSKYHHKSSLGTPISSLIAWVELLKLDDKNKDVAWEVEKDVKRLETITERFSKIGSLPELKEYDIVLETKEAYEYLKLRSSKLIQFSFNSKVENLSVFFNRSLYNFLIP